ncbi:response regulator [Sphingomonas qomolangmaensis]|uniref:Response regulator n=1 Tax=Sphingomonas qomolangmaensis TaxID=2918765 RepID=A0ABY5LEK7_9SPHN|nr:response regulator [Sphingomonas qomolangmaensis]UUL83146.1 response regulator [Sphingomonas qomolangmaensis]
MIVEPEDSVRRSLQLMLQGLRFAVRSFDGVPPALADAYSRNAHVLLLADGVFHAGGGALLSVLRASGWQGRAILVTRSPHLGRAAAANSAGFAAVLIKPVGRLDLLNALAKLF